MPVKILLADKSITIQKVVEMLFSGKEYEVTCVSDGETALSEAARIAPSVVLADVDLPRIDGYSFAGRLRETPALAAVPVILMLSRDDQYDAGRGKLSGIVDHIAKPFESQDLIGKVKKALAAPAAAPAAPPKPKAAPAPPPPKPAAAAPPPPPPRPAAAPPKQAVPSDIFGIIEEAPAPAAARPAPPPPPAAAAEEEFEVEPEYEVEPEPVAPSAAPAETERIFGREPQHEPPMAEPEIEVEPEVVAEQHPEAGFGGFDEPAAAAETALPLGAKAMEEMREGLGLGESSPEGTFGGAEGDFVSFESLDMASRVSHAEYAPPVQERPAPAAPPPSPPVFERPAAAPPPAVTDEMLRAVCREAVERTAREVLERVAWEVIPELAERLIREEIERLKSGS